MMRFLLCGLLTLAMSQATMADNFRVRQNRFTPLNVRPDVVVRVAPTTVKVRGGGHVANVAIANVAPVPVAVQVHGNHVNVVPTTFGVRGVPVNTVYNPGFQAFATDAYGRPVFVDAFGNARVVGNVALGYTGYQVAPGFVPTYSGYGVNNFSVLATGGCH